MCAAAANSQWRNFTVKFRRTMFASCVFFAGTVELFARRPMGADVSSCQGSSVGWPGVKGTGVSFAWAKATEGLTVNDSTFTVNETNARSAGVLIGAYHFAHPELHIGTAGADQEAAHFWGVASNYLKGTGVYLMPMLDVESDLSGASPPYTMTTLSQWVNEWCNDIVNYCPVNLCPSIVCNRQPCLPVAIFTAPAVRV
jgi:GH25 family lysozyme M1 (1,4-beta-N-acetylmuramidase)